MTGMVLITSLVLTVGGLILMAVYMNDDC